MVGWLYDLTLLAFFGLYLFRHSPIPTSEQVVNLLLALGAFASAFRQQRSQPSEALCRWLFTFAFVLLYWQARQLTLPAPFLPAEKTPIAIIVLVLRLALYGFERRKTKDESQEGKELVIGHLSLVIEHHLRLAFLLGACLLTVFALFIYAVLAGRYPQEMAEQVSQTRSVIIKSFEFALLVWVTSLKPTAKISLKSAGGALTVTALLKIGLESLKA